MTPCLAVCLPTIQADTMSTVDTTAPPPVFSLDESALAPAQQAIIKRAVFVYIAELEDRLKGVLTHHFDRTVSKLTGRIDAHLRGPASQLLVLLRMNEQEIIARYGAHFVQHKDLDHVASQDGVEAFVTDQLMAIKARLEAVEEAYHKTQSLVAPQEFLLAQASKQIDALVEGQVSKDLTHERTQLQFAQTQSDWLLLRDAHKVNKDLAHERTQLQFAQVQSDLLLLRDAHQVTKVEHVRTASATCEILKVLEQSPYFRPSADVMSFYEDVTQEPLHVSPQRQMPPPMRAPAPVLSRRSQSPPRALSPAPLPAGPFLPPAAQAVVAAVRPHKRARASSPVVPASAPLDDGWSDEDEPLDEPPLRVPTPPPPPPFISAPLPAGPFDDESSSDDDYFLLDL